VRSRFTRLRNVYGNTLQIEFRIARRPIEEDVVDTDLIEYPLTADGDIDTAAMDNRQALAYWSMEPEEWQVAEAELAEQAPELFAICELFRDEDGEVVQTRVVAWGLAGPERTEVLFTDGSLRGTHQSVDSALQLYSLCTELGVARLSR
jgi:hypothetical protein